MSKISDFLSPLIEKEFNFKKIFKRIFRIFPIMWHGIVPHKNAKFPTKKLPEFSLNSENENILVDTVKEIYKEANERIDNLEEKAFKLLTYISSLSAVVLFLLSKTDTQFVIIFLIFSLIFLFAAILLSLRCINVKIRRTIFIDALFNFEDNEPSQKSKNEIVTSYLDCAVYNQTVADNTTDILKASRYFLTFAFLFAFFCIPFYLPSMNLNDNKPTETIVIFKDTALIEEIKYNQIKLLDKVDTILLINKQKNTNKNDTAMNSNINDSILNYENNITD